MRTSFAFFLPCWLMASSFRDCKSPSNVFSRTFALSSRLSKRSKLGNLIWASGSLISFMTVCRCELAVAKASSARTRRGDSLLSVIVSTWSKTGRDYQFRECENRGKRCWRTLLKSLLIWPSRDFSLWTNVSKLKFNLTPKYSDILIAFKEPVEANQ